MQRRHSGRSVALTVAVWRWLPLSDGVVHAVEKHRPVTAQAVRHVTACGETTGVIAEMDPDGTWVCRRCRKLIGG